MLLEARGSATARLGNVGYFLVLHASLYMASNPADDACDMIDMHAVGWRQGYRVLDTRFSTPGRGLAALAHWNRRRSQTASEPLIQAD